MTQMPVLHTLLMLDVLEGVCALKSAEWGVHVQKGTHMEGNDTPQVPRPMGWRSFSSWYRGVLYTLLAALAVCMVWLLATLWKDFTPQNRSIWLAFRTIFALLGLLALRVGVAQGLVLLFRPQLLGERRLVKIRRAVRHPRVVAIGMIWVGGITAICATGVALDPPGKETLGFFGLLHGYVLLVLLGPAYVVLLAMLVFERRYP